MSLQFIDPTGGYQGGSSFARAARFRELRGLRCNILNNGKQNSDRLLSMVAERLKERYGVIVNEMVKKSKGSMQATQEELGHSIKDADFVLTGTGD